MIVSLSPCRRLATVVTVGLEGTNPAIMAFRFASGGRAKVEETDFPLSRKSDEGAAAASEDTGDKIAASKALLVSPKGVLRRCEFAQ